MATGVGPPEVQSDQGTRELEKDDLRVLFDALLPVAGKYVFFGIQIGVDMNESDEIRKQFNDTRECLLRILRIRLGKTPALTWKDIDTALRSKAVDESRLANALMQEYGHLFSHKQTFESHEDGRKGSEKKHKSTKKKGKYVGEDRSRQVGKERETDSDEKVSESEGFRNLSETPHTNDKSTKTQRKVKKAKKPLEPEKGSERERKQRGDKKKHADISPKSESKVAKNSRERLKGSSQKYREISEQRAPKEVLMKYESEPSSGKYESNVIPKSKHKRKDSGRSGQKCSEKKQVLLKSESISSSEEEIVRRKYESKVIHKSEGQLRKSSRKWSEKVAPKEVQSKSESESFASSSEEETVEVDESETAEKYSSKQEIDSDHGEVSESDRKSYNISTKTQRRVKKAKKHSEPEQGNAKRERKAQIKQQARHGAKIESRVRHKDSHTSTCKEHITPKEVQAKSESESSASSSEEEMVEVGESETEEEYSSEQEQDSENEEVSEDPAEQTRKGEYPSDSEVKVKTKKTKGFVCPENERQKYESIDHQPFQIESDKGDQHKSGTERYTQKRKSRKRQRAEGEISCSVQDEIAVHYRGKAGKSQIAEKTNPLKQIQGKEDERRKAKIQTKAKKITEEQYSDEEVREKPALKPAKRKEHKKLKREDLNEDKHKVARVTQYHKERVSHISDTHTEEKREKDKISTKAIQSSGKTKKGKYHKSDPRQRKDKLAKKQKGKGTPSSDVTEEDSEDEEASSKGSDGEVRRRLAGKSKRIKSKGEYSTALASKGDRMLGKCHEGSEREVKAAVETSEENLEQESESAESSEGEEKARDSVEEEEAEPSDDESAGATSSEEEVKKASKMKNKGRVKIVAKEPDSPGDGYQSDTGGRDRDQEEHSIKPKKRRRRRHRESSPIARGSSSPSTSQEEQQVQKRKSKHESDRERRKIVVKRKEAREKISSSSATDDSSPESEMLRNLTQSETKALVKVFKCLFGRLCCAIKDPVETAAQLQAKHLISCSTMENIITSPESQQVKAITLVRALDRKIKPRPDKIFTVTKVFLENEILQNVGRQLWTETGKICPDRTASMLDNELPSPERQLTVKSVERHEMPGKALPPAIATPTCPLSEEVPVPVLVHSESEPAAESEMPMQTQSSLTAETSSGTSEGVSPQSVGISPVLAKYKHYLQSVYNARVLAPADKYLPTLDAPYINLAMIRRKRYNPEQRDEFTRQTLHGGVDQILQSKTPINIANLLSPEPLKEVGCAPVRFILVEGPPGVGKSTFAWEVCRRWDKIESLRDYHTVVLLKLREKWVLNATSSSNLFRFPPDPTFSKAIAKVFNDCNGHKLLLVLDGFDEVSHSFHRNSVVKSILCRELLPKCTIILTTRPVAKAALRSICQPQVDKHVEIIGFTDEERVRYITEVFSKEPELQVNFLKYMFLVPHIKSMMYIPLNCAIIAQVYYESQSSRHLAIPKTKTQLYQALTHSLLVRHMKMKDNVSGYESMLPEGLNKEDMDKFKLLAKFAFDSYHEVGETRKVTFFKEDIPEGLVHFGFMNESTEMYAGKGVERTFSFLHLSLQEYLAAWHLANSYSIDFQVAYHWLASDTFFDLHDALNIKPKEYYKGDNKEEESLLLSLKQQKLSVVEPAVFLAGITGWRCQSEDDRNHWEMYLSHDTVDLISDCILVRSLFEAQNPTLIAPYFSIERRRDISLDTSNFITSVLASVYDCYAFAYCFAHSTDEFIFSLTISDDQDISLLETLVKGIDNHSVSTKPILKHFKIDIGVKTVENVNTCIFLLMRCKWLADLKDAEFQFKIMKDSHLYRFIKYFTNFQSLKIHIGYVNSLKWLSALKFLRDLKTLHISSTKECSPQHTGPCYWPVESRLTDLVLDMKLPSNNVYDIKSPTDVLMNSVLKSVLRSNTITKLVLPNISCDTMAGVRSILLHCPSLTTLELKRTRLGYDGILYICSALRNNKTLTRLVIHDDEYQLPPSRIEKELDFMHFCSFLSMERVPLPSKTNTTDFLLELNNILKDNTTLKEMKIQSGLFLPLSVSAGGDGEYCQWTGLGPLQQFNVGVVASGMSPNLRRSFSSSDLTQPQTQLFWDRWFESFYWTQPPDINFRMLFSKQKFSLPSFTAPDTEVLQSFSGLDTRLKECLDISDLHQYEDRLGETYLNVFHAKRKNIDDLMGIAIEEAMYLASVTTDEDVGSTSCSSKEYAI